MKQQIGFDKDSDDYEVFDDYGGSTLDIPTIKRLLRCIKKTHPELLQNIK